MGNLVILIPVTDQRQVSSPESPAFCQRDYQGLICTIFSLETSLCEYKDKGALDIVKSGNSSQLFGVWSADWFIRGADDRELENDL